MGVRVQGLGVGEQFLALARILQARAGSHDFAVKAVDELFQELSLPSPANPYDVVVTLEKKGLVRRGNRKGVWRVTPLGRAESAKVVSGIDLAALVAEAAAVGARLGGVPHPIILPEFGAPPELVPILRDFLQEHEFDRNVFGMTRFPVEGSNAPPDPVKDALEAARRACQGHGLEFHLASDRKLHDDLWMNVAAHMWASRYGIGFFEDLAKPKRGLNYNLTTEVGAMLITGRRCSLLKDPSIISLPTDLVGRIRTDVNLQDPHAVEKAIHAWLREDLGLGPCPTCPA